MKFNHILFPTDFSQGSRALNKQVEWLAARFGSRVTLLHVFELPAGWYVSCDTAFINLDWVSGLRDCAARSLKEYSLNIPEAQVQRVLLEGDVAAQIMNYIKAQKVDLVVMGTHSFGALEGLILGSETAKVLHDAGCPIWTDSLLHNQKPSAAVSNILCAVDRIDEAVPLMRFTKQLADDLGATVRLIHAVPEIEAHANRYFLDLHRHLADSARAEIEKLQVEAGTNFPLTIGETGVADALAEAAQDCEADLIVIGRGKARKTLGRFRTHAYDIIRHAPCPVLSCAFAAHEDPRQGEKIAHVQEDQHFAATR